MSWYTKQVKQITPYRIARGRSDALSGHPKISIAMPPAIFAVVAELARKSGTSFAHQARRFIELGIEAERSRNGG